MMYKGRQKIITEYTSSDLQDREVLINMINSTMAIHNVNKYDIDYLMNYRNGSQTILGKEKLVRPEINNKLVLNHAQMVTRSIVGYFLGTPIQYIQSGANKKEEIDALNKYVSYEDKSSVDKEIGEFQSICGTAYRIIYTDGVFTDEVPFEDKALNPSTTYVVYENNIAEKPVCGVTYYPLLDDNGSTIGTKVYVYTDFGLYEIVTDSSTGMVTLSSEIILKEYNVGGVPIIEYPNNMWRLGDWELCIGLMDAINEIHSGRLDDIDQVVQSLLVFINADLDSDRYAEMRESGVVLLKNVGDGTTSIDSINNSLDQTGISIFATELEELLYALLGIPDRANRSGGGGDTGSAVELRDGWADLEIVARNKELTFKKSEKQSLKIILNIMNNRTGTKLSLLDVDIKFSRNKNNNLLVKTQGYSTLLATKTLSPSDCLTIVDLVSDVNEYISRGEIFWGKDFAGKQELELNSQKTIASNATSDKKESDIANQEGVINQE